jgi:hypothetical protein
MSTLAATNLKNPSSGSNNVVLNTDGTTTIAAPSNIIKSGTAVASTSGTAIDFTSIPSWVKRVTVMFNGVSTNGASVIQIQIGSGSVTTSGYSTTGLSTNTNTLNSTTYTSGFPLSLNNAAATVYTGTICLMLITSNTWIGNGGGQSINGNSTCLTFGSSPNLPGTLDRVRITTVNGTDTFDAGSINILYE